MTVSTPGTGIHAYLARPLVRSAVILALLTGGEERSHLLESVRGRGRVHFCDTRAELLQRAREPGVDLAVLGVTRGGGRSAASVIADVRRCAHGVLLLPMFVAPHPSLSDITPVANAAPDDVAYPGADDLRHVLERMLGFAMPENVAEIVMGRIEEALPPAVRPVLWYCLTNARSDLTVAALAAALAVSRKTVAARLARARLPAASQLIGWSRLLMAAYRIEHSENSVERIALDLDFSSGPAFHNMLRRYTGLTAAHIRAQGGFDSMVDLFRRELDRTRAALPVA